MDGIRNRIRNANPTMNAPLEYKELIGPAVTLGITLVGLSIMVGARGLARALSFATGMLLVQSFAWPLFDSIGGLAVRFLPGYISALIVIGVFLFFLRRLLALPLGRRGADFVVSSLALDFIRALIRSILGLTMGIGRFIASVLK